MIDTTLNMTGPRLQYIAIFNIILQEEVAEWKILQYFWKSQMVSVLFYCNLEKH